MHPFIAKRASSKSKKRKPESSPAFFLEKKQYIDQQSNNHFDHYISVPHIVAESTIEQPILSIIVSTYNSEKFLSQCISSIVNQKTNFKFEIVLVDNGSTDSSKKIIDFFVNRYPSIFTYISIDKNYGSCPGRNAGIDFSKGDFLAFVDSDDYLSEAFVERTIEVAKKNDADIVKASFCNFYSTRKKVHNNIYPYSSLVSMSNSFPYEANRLLCYIWGGIYKKSLFEKKRFPYNFFNIIDDRFMKLFIYQFSKKIILIPEVLYYYRHYSNSTSQKKEGKFLNQVFYFESLLKEYSDLSLPKSRYYFNAVMNEISTYLFLVNKNQSQAILKSVFNECHLIYEREFSGIQCELPTILEYYRKSFLNNDFLLWKRLFFYSKVLRLSYPKDYLFMQERKN